jgi:UDP-2,3-diacylglucosamine pyrophosphatase LpxH
MRSDIIIISDIHLGSHICQHDKILHFLQSIEFRTNHLIINGDLFDNWNFTRLSHNHWKILKTIRKASEKIHTTWIAGNHDGPADIISQLLNIEFIEEYRFNNGEKEFIVLHGDIFDEYVSKYPRLAKLADFFYRIVQKLDPSLYLARKLKRSSKTFLRAIEKVEKRALEYCKHRNANVICVGHTHHPTSVDLGYIEYYNSGSWTDTVCTYLTITNGKVNLVTYE